MENTLKVKIGTETVEADPRTFSTGSTGFYFGGKVNLDGKRYQVSLNVVLIGSKPKAA